MLDAGDAVSLSRLYHLNSEPWLNTAAYDDPANEVRYKRYDAPAVALPAREHVSQVESLIAARRSVRSFADRSMPLAELAALLRVAYGAIDLRRGNGGIARFTRSVPSAGALYPLELYAATRRVDGVPDGLYHYGVRADALEPVRGGDAFAAIGPMLLGQTYVAAANVLLIVAAVFERTQDKYGPRGYRYVLLEAGHAVQNVALLAAERGLAALPLGGFEDARLNAYLGLDAPREGAVYLTAVGFPEA
jgi:SagB-type dehydrogenase family enzyme